MLLIELSGGGRLPRKTVGAWMNISQAMRATESRLQGSASAKVLWWVKLRDRKGSKGQSGYNCCAGNSQNTWPLGPGNSRLHLSSNREPQNA